MKILSVGVKMFLEDRQADRHDRFNNRFFQFCLSVKMDLKTGYGKTVYTDTSQGRDQ